MSVIVDITNPEKISIQRYSLQRPNKRRVNGHTSRAWSSNTQVNVIEIESGLWSNHSSEMIPPHTGWSISHVLSKIQLSSHILTFPLRWRYCNSILQSASFTERLTTCSWSFLHLLDHTYSYHQSFTNHIRLVYRFDRTNLFSKALSIHRNKEKNHRETC